MFFQPGEFELWAERMEHKVVPWVKSQGNKGVWEAVRFVSIYKGVLREKLSRLDFAKLVIRVCPSMKGETATALSASMQKGGVNVSPSDVKNYDTLPNDKWLKKYGSVIETLLKEDGNDNEATVVSEPTVRDVMLQSLRNHISTTYRDHWTVMREGYRYEKGGLFYIQPPICVEVYFAESFQQLNKPSYLLAFEFVEKQVTKEDFAILWYHYQRFHHCKLTIVSNKGFTTDVAKAADSYNVALCRVNTHGDLSYILPRALNDGSKVMRFARAILGDKMDTGLFIYDDHCFLSLAEWLMKMNVPVVKKLLLPLPFLSYDDIAHKADSLLPDMRMQGYEVWGFENLLEKENLRCQWGTLPEGQLGRLDVQNRTITISHELQNQESRFRFTVGHELGHYYLHSDILRDYIVTYGENDQSLSYQLSDTANTKRLEYQANVFSACLLMPEKSVFALAYQHFTERERNMGYIWRDNQPVNYHRCNVLIDTMSKEMNVSWQAMYLRMKKLQILREDDSTCQAIGRMQ